MGLSQSPYTDRVRALLIQHDHLCRPGYVGERLQERSFDLEVFQVVPDERFHSPDVAMTFPDPADFDLVVPLGAPWSAYDPVVAAWLQPELEMLREADRAGVPVLGVCFGGQLLAAAHGGRVERSESPEFGWYDVESDHELTPAGLWFQWHQDCWRLPPDALEIARNAHNSQAFVLGRNLAVQFHPEIDAVILGEWLANGGVEEAQAVGLDPDPVLAETRAHEPTNRIRAHRLVDQFLDHFEVEQSARLKQVKGQPKLAPDTGVSQISVEQTLCGADPVAQGVAVYP